MTPNFRGSDGYGREFLLADRLDLGGGDFADCLAALDSWIETSGHDAAAAYIIGTSYGGYLTPGRSGTRGSSSPRLPSTR